MARLWRFLYPLNRQKTQVALGEPQVYGLQNKDTNTQQTAHLGTLSVLRMSLLKVHYAPARR